jgi:8-oxo-dGTP diphosphatase
MGEGLPRVGSALIVRDDANRILLGKRNKDPQRGNWVLPGGKIHAFESIANAAARELAEETGLIVEVQHQFRVYEVINAPQEHRIIIYSWAKVIGGDLRASDDISEVKFVPLDELGDLSLTPLVRAVLTDAARTISRSSKGHTPRKTRGLRGFSPIYGQESLLLELAEAD